MKRLGLLRFSGVLAAIFVLALASGPVASAASVSVEWQDENDGDAADFRFQAAPGEKNHVTVTVSDDTPWTWVVTDTGAPLTALGECTSVDQHTASCPILSSGGHDWGSMAVTLGDGDDWASLKGAGDYYLQGMDGGAGDDDLTGSFHAQLVGGPGADTLRGRLSTAIYERNRRQPVSVTLNGLRDDGEAGENDLVLTPHVSVLGPHDNILIGDERANRLQSGGGNDVIRGGAGNDLLGGDYFVCCSGDDRLYGGPGRDIVSGSGGRDIITGGAGRDVLHGGNGSDRFFARDRFRDKINGGRGTDRARIDRRLDRTRGVERRF